MIMQRRKNMNPDRTETKIEETENKAAEALSMEDLEKVDGAGNPFADVPRVPLKEIDDKIRNNG